MDYTFLSFSCRELKIPSRNEQISFKLRKNQSMSGDEVLGVEQWQRNAFEVQANIFTLRK